MKSLIIFITGIFLCTHLSAQLFYTNPSRLHEAYIGEYKALFLNNPEERSENLTSENFQKLQDQGDKLIVKAEKHVWKDHAEMAMYLNNVGALYAIYLQHGKAERLFKSAMDIWANRLGTEEPQFILSALHLAECYILEGKPYKANPYLNQAYKSLNAFIIPDRLYLIEDELEAVGHYWREGETLAAEYYLTMAMKRMYTEDETDGNFGYLLACMGRLYQEMGRYTESVGFLKEAWHIWSKQNAAFHKAYVYYDDKLLMVPTTIDIDRYLTANTESVALPMGEIEDSYQLGPGTREIPEYQTRGMYRNITPDPKRLHKARTGEQPHAPYREIPLKVKKKNLERDMPKRIFSPKI